MTKSPGDDTYTKEESLAVYFYPICPLKNNSKYENSGFKLNLMYKNKIPRHDSNFLRFLTPLYNKDNIDLFYFGYTEYEFLC